MPPKSIAKVSVIEIEDAANGWIVSIRYKNDNLGEYVSSDKLIFSNKETMLRYIKNIVDRKGD